MKKLIYLLLIAVLFSCSHRAKLIPGVQLIAGYDNIHSGVMDIYAGDTLKITCITTVRHDSDKSYLKAYGLEIDSNKILIPDTGKYWYVCFNPNIAPFVVHGWVSGVCSCFKPLQCCTTDDNLTCQQCGQNPCNGRCSITVCAINRLVPAGIIINAKYLKFNNHFYK